MGIFDKGVGRTNLGFFQRLGRFFVGRTSLDEDALDALEEALVSSDMGVDTAQKVIDRVQRRLGRKEVDLDGLCAVVREEIAALLCGAALPVSPLDFSRKPLVMLVVGVNGVGKTTTLGKLAFQFSRQGKRVVMGAADTFRAAAVEQLAVWASRTGADLVRQQPGTDPAAVAYDAVQGAVSRGADVVLVDTAGRLHSRVDLMQELAKIRRSVSRVVEGAPHEVLLVLDGSTGQNALAQAKAFAEVTQVTSLAVTKLDGSAKGGVVVGIADQLGIPVRYVGVGEGEDDLREFDAKAFAEALFRKEDIENKA